MAISKSTSASSIAASTEQLAASAWAKKHPNLFEQVSTVVFDDGSPRTPATLTLFVEDGAYKLCLNDRAETRTGWIAAATLEAAFQGLEAKLRDGTVEWRRTPQNVGQKGRGRG